MDRRLSSTAIIAVAAVAGLVILPDTVRRLGTEIKNAILNLLGLTPVPETKEQQLAASAEEVTAVLVAAQREAIDRQLEIDVGFAWPSELVNVKGDSPLIILHKESARRRITLRAGDLLSENPSMMREVAFATAILDWKAGRLGMTESPLLREGG